MTTAADDSAVEDAFEAVLAGRRVPEGAAALAAFTGAVRASATEPGRPNAALAELLATGLLTDQSSPSVRTARSAGTSPAGRPSRVRTRRRSAMIFPALIAKFLSAGAVAQAATGATVAVVAFTGVGAVGALPAPVQDTFATVVAEFSPLEPPVSGEASDEVVPTEPVTEDVETIDAVPELPEVPKLPEVPADAEVPAAEAAEAEFQAWALKGPDEGESISAWASAVSKHDVKAWLRDRGMTFGNVVSRWASGKEFSAEELEALGAEAEEESGSTEAESDETAEVETEVEVEETDDEDDDDRGSRGNGNGHGQSNGKSKGKD